MSVKQKRGAIELSINTIIVVVIGITLLSLGLKFVQNIFGDIEEEREGIMELTETQIRELFGETDNAIYIPQQSYQVSQGKTLEDLEVFIRNTVKPGGTFSFVYTIKTLSAPPGMQLEMVTNKIDWVKGEIELQSGSTYKDIVLFNTQNLVLGKYKFEATVSCVAGCTITESKQFIVDIS
tara:strand:- start:624 stop:1163 length:540 start_codon:yes stop_codon:yes gene_type:complete